MGAAFAKIMVRWKTFRKGVHRITLAIFIEWAGAFAGTTYWLICVSVWQPRGVAALRERTVM